MSRQPTREGPQDPRKRLATRRSSSIQNNRGEPASTPAARPHRRPVRRRLGRRIGRERYVALGKALPRGAAPPRHVRPLGPCAMITAAVTNRPARGLALFVLAASLSWVLASPTLARAAPSLSPAAVPCPAPTPSAHAGADRPAVLAHPRAPGGLSRRARRRRADPARPPLERRAGARGRTRSPRRARDIGPQAAHTTPRDRSRASPGTMSSSRLVGQPPTGWSVVLSSWLGCSGSSQPCGMRSASRWIARRCLASTRCSRIETRPLKASESTSRNGYPR